MDSRWSLIHVLQSWIVEMMVPLGWCISEDWSRSSSSCSWWAGNLELELATEEAGGLKRVIVFISFFLIFDFGHFDASGCAGGAKICKKNQKL
jgi:hypothetical protein